MLLHDQDDAFSCGGASPIRHRFSMDAGSSLEGSDGDEEEDKERRDDARDLPDHRGNQHFAVEERRVRLRQRRRREHGVEAFESTRASEHRGQVEVGGGR